MRELMIAGEAAIRIRLVRLMASTRDVVERTHEALEQKRRYPYLRQSVACVVRKGIEAFRTLIDERLDNDFRLVILSECANRAHWHIEKPHALETHLRTQVLVRNGRSFEKDVHQKERLRAAMT